MNIERLTKLAELLERQESEDNFDISFWYRERQCGYVACAIGTACMDPWFYCQGLKLRLYGGWDIGDLAPEYRRRRGWSAVQDFFEISQEDATAMFSPGAYWKRPTTRDVAARIRAMMKWEEQSCILNV